MDKNLKEKLNFIGNVIGMAESKNELLFLLDDLLTPSEIQKIYERIHIVSHLMNKMPQREIAEKTGAGIATVTRGSYLVKKPNFILSNFISKAQKLSCWR
jgi:Trp operon repressor